jgi:hypothetical protein
MSSGTPCSVTKRSIALIKPVVMGSISAEEAKL